ncbi:flavin reductase [Stenotrophomonas panacihumi]|uniref:Flavin reductase n=1 Tax=Stenotrophomonas panacihumi TaxID=676599 RepID=A0A0R0A0Q5_9GAMM|nr:flavin reductase family protein [Stenotrophomonas panacihumi]KRG38843.1 flavin reductase [Stenotrophomonas panacihumi]PTN53061.1 flavin reductase family protein [Stenotrophomonas panacihumi]
MKQYRQHPFPVEDVRRFLEPGPIVLVSTAWRGQRDVMTLGWHMVMGFSPSLWACYLWNENHSFELAKRSRECVINLPTVDIVDTVVRIGNSSGAEIDKFASFGLSTTPGEAVAAPRIRECWASFECRLHDGSQINKHNLFIWEVVRAHVAHRPKTPRTVHYRGDGRFMVSGPDISRKRMFLPEML